MCQRVSGPERRRFLDAGVPASGGELAGYSQNPQRYGLDRPAAAARLVRGASVTNSLRAFWLRSSGARRAADKRVAFGVFDGLHCQVHFELRPVHMIGTRMLDGEDLPDRRVSSGADSACRPAVSRPVRSLEKDLVDDRLVADPPPPPLAASPDYHLRMQADGGRPVLLGCGLRGPAPWGTRNARVFFDRRPRQFHLPARHAPGTLKRKVLWFLHSVAALAGWPGAH